MEECIFCKIVTKEIPSEKVCESENFIGILDVNPISKGHTLIISKKHYENILDFPTEYSKELIELIKKRGSELIKTDIAEGLTILQRNFTAAQQEVPHLHFHIIPRKKSDGFEDRF